MTDHSTHIMGGSGGYAAGCSCGYEGARFPRVQDAHNDADAHVCWHTGRANPRICTICYREITGGQLIGDGDGGGQRFAHPECYRKRERQRIETRRRVAGDGARARLEALHGTVWDTDQMRADFEVLQYAAPYVAVRRRADGVEGSLVFQHSPRFYWDFSPDAGPRP